MNYFNNISRLFWCPYSGIRYCEFSEDSLFNMKFPMLYVFPFEDCSLHFDYYGQYQGLHFSFDAIKACTKPRPKVSSKYGYCLSKDGSLEYALAWKSSSKRTEWYKCYEPPVDYVKQLSLGEDLAIKPLPEKELSIIKAYNNTPQMRSMREIATYLENR